ncbi:MAG: enolase C-terminal domain-like protein [Planctomycetia bacterium]|nr:enolase C-terminal domain-like protein [Planctomycetia bacterium]
MLIQNGTVALLEKPLKKPLFFRNQPTNALKSVVVTLVSNSGIGQAEAPSSLYPEIMLENLYHVLDENVLPLLVGKNISSLENLRELLGMWAEMPLVFAMLEMAWWNLLAAEKNQPLCQTLGADSVSQQLFTPLDRPLPDAEGFYVADDFMNELATLVEKGYVHLELKIRPGWDLAMVRYVRQDFPELSFHLDVEGQMSPQQNDTLLQFRDFFPYMIEQPFAFDNLTDHADLQEMLTCPVCLDESITSPNVARSAIRWNACKCVKIHPLRVGGFAAAKEIVELCRDAHVGCWISSPLQTAVGMNHCLALSCLDGFTGPFEYYDPETYFQDPGTAPWPSTERDEENTLRIRF